ncbi:MAG: DHA2 family efflux MFS transporter permease subunit [Syntrophales bacterium]
MTDSKGAKWMITATVIMGTLMSAIDTSIVNVAMPYMRGSLGTSVEEITWVATGYMLSCVLIMPIIGMLSGRFGRRNFYLFSIFLFTVSSMLCGMAWDLSSMVIFRAIQGIGGGALIPISQAILRETFPPEEQGTAMGIYGLGVVLGPAFGPTLGGWLTDTFSWPWIFYINVPVGILNILMVLRYIHDPPYLTREKGKIDLLGLFLLTAGLGALQLMLEKGEQKQWFESNYIQSLALTAAAGLLLFVWRELTADRPAVDLRILKNVSFASATALGGVLGIGLYGSMFLLPLFLQQLLGYPAYDSGLTLMPRSIAMAITMPAAGRIYNKLGPRWLVGIGLGVNVLSFWELSRLSLNVGYWNIFVPQFLQGVGFGLVFVALSTAAFSTVERARMTAASGMYNVIRQVFGSVGIAVAASQLTRAENGYRALLVEHITDYRNVTDSWIQALSGAMLGGGADKATAHERALSLLDGEVMRQASMLAYNHVYLLVACLFMAMLPLVFLLRGKTSAKAAEIIVD